jgi:hypothetical protein
MVGTLHLAKVVVLTLLAITACAITINIGPSTDVAAALSVLQGLRSDVVVVNADLLANTTDIIRIQDLKLSAVGSPYTLSVSIRCQPVDRQICAIALVVSNVTSNGPIAIALSGTFASVMLHGISCERDLSIAGPAVVRTLQVLSAGLESLKVFALNGTRLNVTNVTVVGNSRTNVMLLDTLVFDSVRVSHSACTATSGINPFCFSMFSSTALSSIIIENVLCRSSGNSGRCIWARSVVTPIFAIVDSDFSATGSDDALAILTEGADIGIFAVHRTKIALWGRVVGGWIVVYDYPADVCTAGGRSTIVDIVGNAFSGDAQKGTAGPLACQFPSLCALVSLNARWLATPKVVPLCRVNIRVVNNTADLSKLHVPLLRIPADTRSGNNTAFVGNNGGNFNVNGALADTSSPYVEYCTADIGPSFVPAVRLPCGSCDNLAACEWYLAPRSNFTDVPQCGEGCARLHVTGAPTRTRTRHLTPSKSRSQTRTEATATATASVAAIVDGRPSAAVTMTESLAATLSLLRIPTRTTAAGKHSSTVTHEVFQWLSTNASATIAHRTATQPLRKNNETPGVRGNDPILPDAVTAPASTVAAVVAAVVSPWAATRATSIRRITAAMRLCAQRTETDEFPSRFQFAPFFVAMPAVGDAAAREATLAADATGAAVMTAATAVTLNAVVLVAAALKRRRKQQALQGAAAKTIFRGSGPCSAMAVFRGFVWGSAVAEAAATVAGLQAASTAQVVAVSVAAVLCVFPAAPVLVLAWRGVAPADDDTQAWRAAQFVLRAVWPAVRGTRDDGSRLLRMVTPLDGVTALVIGLCSGALRVAALEGTCGTAATPFVLIAAAAALGYLAFVVVLRPHADRFELAVSAVAAGLQAAVLGMVAWTVAGHGGDAALNGTATAEAVAEIATYVAPFVLAARDIVLSVLSRRNPGHDDPTVEAVLIMADLQHASDDSELQPLSNPLGS